MTVVTPFIPLRRARSAARIRSVLVLAGLALTITGCGDSITRTIGLVRDAPDEFTVTTRAPLAMPPSFDLPPPTPGLPRPQETPERIQAEEALVPQTALGAAPAAETAGTESARPSRGSACAVRYPSGGQR